MFLHIKTCVIGIKKNENIWGLNPGSLTLHAVVLPLSYGGDIHVSGKYALLNQMKSKII